MVCLNKYLIYLIGFLAIFSMVPSVGAWNIMFKSSSVTTVWYYPNATYPIYIPVGFVNQSIYIQNLPQSLETSNFTLYFSSMNSTGFISSKTSKVITFIPYSTSYVIPSTYTQRGGEYTIKAGNGAHSEFLLFNRSTVPSNLYNSSASAIVVYANSNSLQNQLNSVNAITNNNANQISKINSQLGTLNATSINGLKSTVGLLEIAIVILFIVVILLFLFLYRKHKSTEEIYNVRSTYGEGSGTYYNYDKGAGEKDSQPPTSGNTDVYEDTSAKPQESQNYDNRNDVWPGEEKYKKKEDKPDDNPDDWPKDTPTKQSPDKDSAQSDSKDYDSGISEE